MDQHVIDIEEILHRKRRLLRRRKIQVPLQGVRAQAMMQVRPLDVINALRDGAVSVMAEVKRALADGALVTRYDPAALAACYEAGGAAVLSVATDETVLRGGPAHLIYVKRAVNIPVIRHDFIFDPYQVYQTRAMGADGVRIIARLLSDQALRYFLSLTQRLKMTALIEVQTVSQLERVTPLEPRLIGLNNRNWETGEIDFTVTERLRAAIPQHIAVISGGGIRTGEDVKRVAATGIDAIFIGEALLTAENGVAKLQEVLSLI